MLLLLLAAYAPAAPPVVVSRGKLAIADTTHGHLTASDS